MAMNDSKSTTDLEKAQTAEIVQDIKSGEVVVLDASELFLRENGLTHDEIHDLLEDSQQTKALVRRIDVLLMPLMMGTYTLQYIDKQAMSYAAVFDLLGSTNTTKTQYSWLATIFYLGTFLFMEF
jgi:hypothetical protein